MPVAMLLCCISWFVSPAIAAAALLFGQRGPAADAAGAVADLLRKPVDLPLGMHLRVTLQSLGRPLAQSVLTFVFLPYEAYISADAIVAHAGAHGLDQTAAAGMEDRERFGTRRRRHLTEDTFRAMAFAPALAAAACWCSPFTIVASAALRGALIAAWMASPLVAWWLSQPIRRPRCALGEPASLSRKAVAEDVAVLRGVRHGGRPIGCRRTTSSRIPVWWSRRAPVRRTSAWRLLADLAAYDFGYCSAAQFLARTQRTFETLSRMERYRGHFFNWYDTRSLAPLHPALCFDGR
jgi:cyclic beta-1,2-glucan synthetase